MPYADFRQPQSLNLYAYLLNNPLNSIDPDGHQGKPCEAGQACVTTAGVPLGESPENRAAADANPAYLQVYNSDENPGGIGGEIYYEVKNRPAGQDFMVVQAESSTDRASTTEFGPGTSKHDEPPRNQFHDAIDPAQPIGKKAEANSVQTFYIVPINKEGRSTGAPQPVNVRDREGNRFNALGVYINQSDRRTYINGNPIDSRAYKPPKS